MRNACYLLPPLIFSLVLFPIMGMSEESSPLPAWECHTIDRSSQGADGVRLGDLNGDGLADVVTGWEEGGLIRAYLNPGADKAARPWPAVTVGRVDSPEDAVFVDLDQDGALDVVSCCEGQTRSIFVHWAPRDRTRLLDPKAWHTEPFPAARGKEAWMYALPMQVDGLGGVDLVVGSKGKGASISWLESPNDPRDLKAWKLNRLRDAGWIMSIEAEDIDADGREDLVFSDRKGARAGVFWLKRPQEVAMPWSEHPIGALGKEVMFLRIEDLESDGRRDVVVSTRNGYCELFRRKAGVRVAWASQQKRLPFGLPHGKSLAIADINGDGRRDLITTNRGGGKVRCVAWQPIDPAQSDSKAHDIGGFGGQKFDLIEMIDLDADGDLDVLTCEERDGLGVVWYENPADSK
ncbi:MAG: hypothetical protein ACI9UA_001207 [Pseudoalteromonas tetraodonis]|jgi:hypothetical protein